jgi:hypothetical protein
LFDFIYFVYLKMEKCKMQMVGSDLLNQLRAKERNMPEDEYDARTSLAIFLSNVYNGCLNRECAQEMAYLIHIKCRVPGTYPMPTRHPVFSLLAPERLYGDMTVKELEDGMAKCDLEVQKELQKRKVQTTVDKINHKIRDIQGLNAKLTLIQQRINADAVARIKSPIVDNPATTIDDAKHVLDEVTKFYEELFASISRNQQEEDHQDQAEPVAHEEPELS